jgi:DNA-binding MarR family transcriptional regulator/GNAT superfamily N-acetyltransferase
MDADAVRDVRRFNRTVTQRIGVLNDGYLARDRPLGASRVLWEIGDGEVGDVRSLRARLDLDSGYLSRLLRTLERDGLVEVRTDPADKRVRTVGLTPQGKAEVGLLDQQSDALAWSLLAPLNEDQRTRLAAAMGVVERLLTAGSVEIAIEDPASAAARFCIESYFAELDVRFDAGFDSGRTTAVDVDDLTEPAGLLLVARLHGDPVGCCALRLRGSAVGEVKRMWVAPSARGLGVGRRILHELEQHARARGVDVLRLDTNRALREAIELYRSSGFVEVERFNDEAYAHHWFAKHLTEG